METELINKKLRQQQYSELFSLPFKDLSDVLEAVFHYLRWYRFIKESGSPLSPESSTTNDLDRCFEFSLTELPEEERRIIEYEFRNRRNTGWWNEYYSRSTYYRLKRCAIVDLILNLKETGNNVILNILNSKFEGE